MMKKLFFLVTILMMILVGGCSYDERNTETSSEEATFPELPDEIAEIEKMYREEILSRTNSSINFLPDDTIEASDMIHLANSVDFFSEQEINAFEKYGYTIVSKKGLVEHDSVTYYYPIIFHDDDKLVVLYDYQGKFQKRNLDPEQFRAVYEEIENETVHFDEPSYEVWNYAEINAEYALVYDDSGKIQKWRFGKLTASYNLSRGLSYEGKSELEGYIFQCGNNVYALTYEGQLNQLAQNVDKVIVCNHRLNADYYSQPLFLMQNGKLQAFAKGSLQNI